VNALPGPAARERLPALSMTVPAARDLERTAKFPPSPPKGDLARLESEINCTNIKAFDRQYFTNEDIYYISINEM